MCPKQNVYWYCLLVAHQKTTRLLGVFLIGTVALGFGCAITNSARWEKGVIVRGRVLHSPKSKPVAGATVRLRDHFDGQNRTAKTNRHGEYVLRDVPPSVYTATITDRPAGLWTDGEVVRVGLDEVRASDLCLRLPQRISGVVRDVETHKPVPGVRIHFSTADRNWDAITTTRDGKFSLFVTARPVTVHCQGTAERYYPLGQANTPAQVRKFKVGTKQQLRADFEVRSAPKVVGQIVDLNGKPLAHASVHLQFTPRQNAKGLGFGFGARGSFGDFFHLRKCTTDKQGRFYCYARRQLPSDRKFKWLDVTVTAKTRDNSLGAFAELSLAYPAPVMSLKQLPLQPCPSVRFHIVDNKNSPLAQAKPKMEGYFRQGSYHVGYCPPLLRPRFQSLGKGQFRAVGILPGAKCNIGATSKGYELQKAILMDTTRRGGIVQNGTIRMQSSGRQSVPRLLKLLNSKNPYQREYACAMLGEHKTKTVVAALRKALRNDVKNTVRYSAAAALGKIGPQARPAVLDLIVAVKLDTDGVAREAAKALGLLGDKVAVPALGDALDGGDSDVRRAATEALGMLGKESPEAVQLLIGVLHDKSTHVRRAALKGLGKCGGSAKRAVPALIRVLGNGPSYLRPHAATALGHIGQKSAAAALQRAAKSEDDALFRAAVRALRRLKRASK